MSIINRQTLKTRLDRGEHFHLVDALPEEAYQEGHIPGAISMPADTVAERAESYFSSKDEPIVTYCANKNCNASAKAAQQLRRMGYTNVSEYTDGKEDWEKAGLPLERADDMLNGMQEALGDSRTRQDGSPLSTGR